MRPALLGLLALLALSACRSGDDVTMGEEGKLQLGREEARTVVERTVRLEGRTLVLDADAGSITVVGTGGEVAQLRFEQVARGATAASAQERLDRLTIEEAGDAEIYQYLLRAGDVEGARVNVEARVPATTPLHVRLERGAVRLSGTAGNVTVENESGPVEAAGLAGPHVELRTELGNVEAGFVVLPGEAVVRLETENGNIILILPGESSADVDAETQTGSISVQGLTFSNRTLDQDGVQQRFRGRLGRGDAEVHATTEVGTITLNEGQRLELDDLDLFDPAAADTTVVPPGAPVAPTQ